jgi:hypothetical protein
MMLKLYNQGLFNKDKITREDVEKVKKAYREHYPEQYEKHYGWQAKTWWTQA